MTAVLLLFHPLLLAQQQPQKTGPQQPLPYSHKQHLALGLKCVECHVMAPPGEMMGLPKTGKCMSCHIAVSTEKPAIVKLAEAAKAKKEIPWVRIYQIPAYVAFSHKVHVEIGARCSVCHGEVAARDVLFKEGDISMGACMNCHREHKASNDCGYCHDPR